MEVREGEDGWETEKQARARVEEKEYFPISQLLRKHQAEQIIKENVSVQQE